jgi:hypothetical protein
MAPPSVRRGAAAGKHLCGCKCMCVCLFLPSVSPLVSKGGSPGMVAGTATHMHALAIMRTQHLTSSHALGLHGRMEEP